MPIIEIENLTYSYPGFKVPVLHDVNLMIEKGEFVILAGPTGCGKSTLCRCINGLIPHFYGGELKGKVKVAGFLTTETPISILAQQVGFIFQNPENQTFMLSVEREIAYGPENLGLSKEEIGKRLEWCLNALGLSKLRKKVPFELSGGQQQRLAIASILAMKPKILILDEPTSSLDPLAAEKIIRIIKKLNEELNMTIIFIEHRLDLVVPFANRIVIMKEGSIAFDRKPEEILEREEARSIGIAIPRFIQLHKKLEMYGKTLPKFSFYAKEEAEIIRRELL